MRNRITEHHNTSLRLPKHWHEFMEQFAKQWDTPTSYVYRQAIRDFITKRNQQTNV